MVLVAQPGGALNRSDLIDWSTAKTNSQNSVWPERAHHPITRADVLHFLGRPVRHQYSSTFRMALATGGRHLDDPTVPGNNSTDAVPLVGPEFPALAQLPTPTAGREGSPVHDLTGVVLTDQFLLHHLGKAGRKGATCTVQETTPVGPEPAANILLEGIGTQAADQVHRVVPHEPGVHVADNEFHVVLTPCKGLHWLA